MMVATQLAASAVLRSKQALEEEGIDDTEEPLLPKAGQTSADGAPSAPPPERQVRFQGSCNEGGYVILRTSFVYKKRTRKGIDSIRPAVHCGQSFIQTIPDPDEECAQNPGSGRSVLGTYYALKAGRLLDVYSLSRYDWCAAICRPRLQRY